MRLMLIGIDALDFTLFNELVKVAGDYNAIKMTPEYPSTGESWTTLFTGMKMEHHGITDPWGRYVLGDRGRLAENSKNYPDVTVPYLWQYLNQAGFKCGIIGAPMTYPPTKNVNAFHISGFPVPDVSKRDFFFPKSIEQFIPQDYKLDISDYNVKLLEYTNPLAKGQNAEWGINWVMQQIAQTLETFNTLNVNVGPVDFGSITFTFVDRFGHEFASQYRERIEPVLTVYNMVNTVLETIEELFHPDNTIIISDHGMNGVNADSVHPMTGNKLNSIHNNDATFAFKGDAFVSVGVSVENFSNLDVTPTILHTFEVPLPLIPALDGEIPYQILSGTAMSPEDEELVRKRLRGLGYIE